MSTLNNPSYRNTVHGPVSVLVVVGCDEQRLVLQRLLSHSAWRTHFTGRVQDVERLLASGGIGVVLADCELRAGTWRDVLTAARRVRNPPRVVVTGRLADEALWAEVLNLGGYDVLAQPFDAHEVFRSLMLAWLSWRGGSRRAA